MARLPIGGVEPQTRAPYFRLALWNSTGSKLDYYIHASLDWASSTCGAKQHVTVTVHLLNSAPDGLPGYVLGETADKQFHIPPGDEYLAIMAYATDGAELSRYTVNGRATEPAQFAELGHPVWSDGQYVRRGQPMTIVYDIVEPASTAGPDRPGTADGQSDAGHRAPRGMSLIVLRAIATARLRPLTASSWQAIRRDQRRA